MLKKMPQYQKELSMVSGKRQSQLVALSSNYIVNGLAEVLALGLYEKILPSLQLEL